MLFFSGWSLLHSNAAVNRVWKNLVLDLTVTVIARNEGLLNYPMGISMLEEFFNLMILVLTVS